MKMSYLHINMWQFPGGILKRLNIDTNDIIKLENNFFYNLTNKKWKEKNINIVKITILLKAISWFNEMALTFLPHSKEILKII